MTATYPFPTKDVTTYKHTECTAAMIYLTARRAFFAITPMPDDACTITVREEEAEGLAAYIRSVRDRPHLTVTTVASPDEYKRYTCLPNGDEHMDGMKREGPGMFRGVPGSVRLEKISITSDMYEALDETNPTNICQALNGMEEGDDEEIVQDEDDDEDDSDPDDEQE